MRGLQPRGVVGGGFWPGGAGIDFPALYSYAYPTPEAIAEAVIAPQEAYFSSELGEFLLPYDAVRQSADPDANLLAFLDTTYRAAAELGRWNRDDFECPLGEPRRPRPL